MRAHRLLEVGVSLAEQGWCDDQGEAPALLLDWLVAVSDVVAKVRAEKQAEAVEAARSQRR